MIVAELTDAQVLLEGGDGSSYDLKAYKAKLFAEEIVRLRAENEALRAGNRNIEEGIKNQADAIDALRAENAKLKSMMGRGRP